MYVTGSLRVRSTYPKLDTMLIASAGEFKSFQIVVELKKLGEAIKTLTFDDCYLEGKTYAMDANGVGTSDYSFTATRVREQ
jgi:hypothetical protein